MERKTSPVRVTCVHGYTYLWEEMLPKEQSGNLPDEEGMFAGPTRATGPYKDLTDYLGADAEGFPGGDSGEEPSCQGRRHEMGGGGVRCSIPESRRSPGGHGNPFSVFLPGSHGQRSLAGFASPQGHTESDMTEAA